MGTLVQSPLGGYVTPNSAKSRKGVLFSVSIYGLCQKAKARARRSRDRNKRRCRTVSGFHENTYSTAQFASTALCLLHAGREALYFKSSIFRLEIDSIRRREAEQERLWQIQKREKGRGMPIKFRTIFCPYANSTFTQYARPMEWRQTYDMTLKRGTRVVQYVS